MDGQRGTHTMASTKSFIGLVALGLTESQSVCTPLDELRQAITDEIHAIPATMVYSAILGVVRKARLLLSIDGQQLGLQHK